MVLSFKDGLSIQFILNLVCIGMKCINEVFSLLINIPPQKLQCAPLIQAAVFAGTSSTPLASFSVVKGFNNYFSGCCN